MVYCYRCPHCKVRRNVTRPMVKSGDPVLCECGHRMGRDYRAEQTGVIGNYQEPIISDSMAFDSVDVVEHRKRFPGIDLKIDGRTARPILRSLRQKRAYLKGRNWQDRNSFI